MKQAIEIDKENGKTLWLDAIKLEMDNFMVAFKLYGEDSTKLVGYKNAGKHLVFDIKLGENFRRKAHLVADGHTTDTPPSITYSLLFPSYYKWD